VKSFSAFIIENTTANMVYLTRDFTVDNVPVDFDVEDFPESNGEKTKHMKRPWEVRNAEEATTRRTHLLMWMKASSEFKKQAVNGMSLPLTPKWQSRIR
jgi:hypothetical protein